MENLSEKEPEIKEIIFNDASPKISNVAFEAFRHALNQRRPFCSNDSVPVYFIADMHKDCR